MEIEKMMMDGESGVCPFFFPAPQFFCVCGECVCVCGESVCVWRMWVCACGSRPPLVAVAGGEGVVLSFSTSLNS